jgi:hypothetical protein
MGPFWKVVVGRPGAGDTPPPERGMPPLGAPPLLPPEYEPSSAAMPPTMMKAARPR